LFIDNVTLERAQRPEVLKKYECKI
jgi:hypothetical protein